MIKQVQGPRHPYATTLIINIKHPKRYSCRIKFKCYNCYLGIEKTKEAGYINGTEAKPYSNINNTKIKIT